MEAAWLLALLPALPLVTALVNVMTWRRPRPASQGGPECVSVLIPARNEAANLGSLLESLRHGQPEVGEILVYDDDSTDGTADLVREMATLDPRIRLLPSQPLPRGWLGKPHAGHRLAEAAAYSTWLFVDADVRLKRGAVGGLYRLHERRGILGADVVTAVPRQIVGSFFERLILPLLHLTYLAWLPLRLVELTRTPSVTAANGQLLMVGRDAYQRCGGFDAIRAELVDDMALCRRAKSRGLRVCFADAHHLAECRMYRGTRRVWEGFSKNLYSGLGRSPGLLFGVVTLYSSCFVAPYVGLALGLSGSARVLLPAMLGVAQNVALRLLLALRYRQPIGGLVLHPISVLGLVAIAVNSMLWVLRRDVRWSGRSYSLTEGAMTSRRKTWFTSLARAYVRRRLRRQFEAVLVHGLDATRAHAKAGPILLASNHVAWWDPFLLVALDEALGTIGHCLMDSKGLRELPFFSWVGAVPLHRDDARAAQRDLKGALELARSPSQLLVIFPQGRQVPAHLPLSFESGIGWLAANTRATVIPAAVRYDFGEGPRMIARISLGSPVALQPSRRRAFVRALEAAVQRELERIDATTLERPLPDCPSKFVPLLAPKPSGRIPLLSRLLSTVTEGHP